MTIQDFIDKIENEEKERRYWFVRTDNGLYYDTYLANNFIAIGWNHITVDDIVNTSEEDIKAKIARNSPQKQDQSDISYKMKISGIYNKIIRFKELRKGDIIVIPNEGSGCLAFGEIITDHIYVKIDGENGCGYHKRREVKWHRNGNINSFDPHLRFIKRNMHTISEVKSFQPYIDNVLNHLYKRGEYAHYVIEVNLDENINLRAFTDLVSSIEQLSKIVNEEFGLGEDMNETAIKLQLQSPGNIEILSKGRNLMVLAAFLSFTSCGNKNAVNLDQETKANFEKLQKQHSGVVDTCLNAFDKLETDKFELDNL
eukprot:TRINITY_DN776242_c0_g1_i1.p1 TRINITY_DN776242_c0_g1~~TRINITY_DN776242_c0_g1_i1.p1  ORF type:complete len:313 (+),score=32.11 TRINITY_DN776242_c0_g1_i1:629-1567(+)